MPKPFTPKVVTANALLEGDAIYQTATGWTRHLTEAEVMADKDTAEARLADGAAQAGSIVGAYLADVELIDGLPTPAHFREDFRAKGPSNYAHGKQEQF